MEKLAIASSNIEEASFVSPTELDLLHRRMDLLKTVITDTDDVPPWPYDLSQLLRLIAAGTLPLILILIERPFLRIMQILL